MSGFDSQLLMMFDSQDLNLQHSIGVVSKEINPEINGDVLPSIISLPLLTVCGKSPDAPHPLNGRLD